MSPGCPGGCFRLFLCLCARVCSSGGGGGWSGAYSWIPFCSACSHACITCGAVVQQLSQQCTFLAFLCTNAPAWRVRCLPACLHARLVLACLPAFLTLWTRHCLSLAAARALTHPHVLTAYTHAVSEEVRVEGESRAGI